MALPLTHTRQRAHVRAGESTRESVSDRPVTRLQSSSVQLTDRRFAVKTALQMLEALVATSRKLGPYVLLEVLLPGGTLFAMTLFVYRNPGAARRYVARLQKAFKRAVAATRNAIRRRAARVPSLTTGIEAAMRALG